MKKPKDVIATPEEREVKTSLRGQVWSDKLNAGHKFIITDELLGTGAPGGTKYVLFSPSNSYGPRVQELSEVTLRKFYTHRPEVDPEKIAPGALSTENVPV